MHLLGTSGTRTRSPRSSSPPTRRRRFSTSSPRIDDGAFQPFGGATEVRSLADPSSLRPLLKRCPEAFLSRRVVINEGKTEYGVMLRLMQDWDSGTEPRAGAVGGAGRGLDRRQRRHGISEVGTGVPRMSATKSSCSSTATTPPPTTWCRT